MLCSGGNAIRGLVEVLAAPQLDRGPVLGLVLTLVGNPHRSLSAVIPDSFRALGACAGTQQMLERRSAAITAVALIPAQASVAADTPCLCRCGPTGGGDPFPGMFATAIVRVWFKGWIGLWPFPAITRHWLQCSRDRATNSSAFSGNCGNFKAVGRLSLGALPWRALLFCSGPVTQRQSGAPALAWPVPVPGLIDQPALH